MDEMGDNGTVMVGGETGTAAVRAVGTNLDGEILLLGQNQY